MRHVLQVAVCLLPDQLSLAGTRSCWRGREQHPQAGWHSVNIANLNALIRVIVAGLLALCGIALVAYAGVLILNGATIGTAQLAIPTGMLTASGLTAWDTHLS